MAKKKPQTAILVEQQYQVLEVWYPYLRLKEEGIPVKLIGSGTAQVYPSKEGYPCEVHTSIDKVSAKDFDAVIIPGGWAPDFLRRHKPMVDFVKKIYQSGKVVGSICHGGWMLVSADICRGHKLTSFYAIKDDVIAAGGEYLDREVVVDKNLVTSRKPDDLPRFVQEIIKLINK